MNMKDKLQYICMQFRIPGEILVYRWIPSGHINTAYYVAVYNGKEITQLLVQKINTYVVRDPIGMMRNIELLTEHVRGQERTMEKRRRLHFRHTADLIHRYDIQSTLMLEIDLPHEGSDKYRNLSVEQFAAKAYAAINRIRIISEY